jgi:hypothetical protein
VVVGEGTVKEGHVQSMSRRQAVAAGTEGETLVDDPQ